MIRCLHCGAVIEEEEKIDLPNDTDGGTTICPHCEDDTGFEEVEQCPICCKWFADYELQDGVCKPCFDWFCIDRHEDICDLIRKEYPPLG